MSGFMHAVISSIHVVSCIALVVSILLQSGKGGGLAGAFGQGSTQTLFGGRGAATFLTRASTTLAVIFFLTSLTLGLTASRSAGTAGRSLIQEEAKRRAAQQSTQTPAPGGATQGGATQGGAVPGSMTPAPASPPAQTSPAPSNQGGTTPQGSGGTK